RRQPVACPGEHVVQAAADAAGGIHRGGVDDRAVGVDDHVATVATAVRLRHVAHRIAVPAADPAACHPERIEYLASQQLRIGRTPGRGSDLADDYIQQVVVGVAGTEAVGRLDVFQAGD